MSGQHYGRRLTVIVQDGQLVIAIGVQTLAHAVSYADWANPYDETKGDYLRTFAITDAAAFAKDVKSVLHAQPLTVGDEVFLFDLVRAMVSSDTAAVELLRRLRTWDHLDAAADGPYWKKEIDTILSSGDGR